MKLRLRGDLRDALRGGRGDEAKLVRSLIAALDNGEAPPLQADHKIDHTLQFASGNAEIGRLDLDAEAVGAIIAGEIAEREQAAAEMERLGQHAAAQALRAEMALASRYLD